MIEGSVEQRARRFPVVFAFEEIKESRTLLVELVVVAVVEDGDATNRPRLVHGEEECSVRVPVKRVAAPVEHPARIGRQRRHPLRNVPVDVEG